METTSIVLPSALTAANSKKLLSSCRSALTKGELHLDGSSLTSMDYSADAFFALLAELSEKTGNKLKQTQSYRAKSSSYPAARHNAQIEIGRASCRERV